MNSYAWFVRGAEHAAMCRTSVESVLRADKDARVIVVTDEDTPDWCIPGALLLHVDAGQPIMLANLDAQISALACAWTDNDESITFLDTDTLLLRPIPLYGDIAFTWRDSIGTNDDGEKVEGIAQRMPYNYGVIVALPCLKSLEAFVWMRERIRGMHSNHQKWYGNQLAAVELAGPPPVGDQFAISKRRLPWRLTSLGKTLHIGKIPCDIYNWTPQSADEDLADKSVLHFKGARRALMETYAAKLGLGWYVEKKKAA